MYNTGNHQWTWDDQTQCLDQITTECLNNCVATMLHSRSKWSYDTTPWLGKNLAFQLWDMLNTWAPFQCFKSRSALLRCRVECIMKRYNRYICLAICFALLQVIISSPQTMSPLRSDLKFRKSKGFNSCSPPSYCSPRKGHSYDAKVVHVNPRIGAFVDLGAVANGLIPLKMLGRTGNPTDISSM